MDWTRNEPQEPGFYWLYAPWYGDEPKLYWVYWFKEQAYMRPAQTMDGAVKLWPGRDYCWYGPIERPQPPQEGNDVV